MADGLLQTILRQLGVEMPEAGPAPTPDQQALHETMVKKAQEQWSPVRKAVTGVIEGVPQFLKGATMSDPGMSKEQFQQTSPWEKGGMLAATAPLGLGPKGIKGLYSRVEQIAQSLPETIQPGKLTSILKNRASGEEVKWRGLDKLLAGEKPIKTEAVVEQLQKRPLDVKVKEYGLDPVHSSNDEWLNTAPDSSTTYSAYTMPDAKNYRETLIQLVPGSEKRTLIGMSPLEQFEFAPQTGADLFRSHHWMDPNVLVHVRHNERNLRTQPQYLSKTQAFSPSGSEKATHRTSVISDKGEPVASVFPPRPIGEEGSIPELRGQADDLIYEMMTRAPEPDTGRMLENVQSDWHQRGAHSGYLAADADPVMNVAKESPEVEAYRTQLDGMVGQLEERLGLSADNVSVFERAERLEDLLGHANTETWEVHLPKRMVTPESFEFDDGEAFADSMGRYWKGPSVKEIRGTKAYAQEYASRFGGTVGNNLISAATAESNRQDVMRLREAETALDNAIDATVRSHDAKVPDAPFKDSWAELALKQQLLEMADRPDLNWLGIAPASELNMRGEQISPAFQDVQLPKTLEKLIRPFGGKLEKADLGIKKTIGDIYWDASVGNQGGFKRRNLEAPNGYEAIFSMINRPDDLGTDVGPSGPINEARNLLQNQVPNIQAFIARLTPEMKQQIKEKGFPLLMALLAKEGIDLEGNADAR